MKKIAFQIQKGGVGKTTLSGNIAFSLSLFKKTILIDCDPQGNLTSWFVTEPMEWEFADILLENTTIKDTLKKVRENLWFIPTFAIDGSLKNWSETTLFQKPFAFVDIISQIEKFGFEYAIFDLGPGISNLERSILACMDEVVGVAAAEFFSFDGLEMFNNELKKLKSDRRATFKNNKLVINRLNKSFALHQEYREQFNKLTYKLFIIGQSTSISDCIPSHKTLMEYDKSNKNVPELKRLTTAIMKG